MLSASIGELRAHGSIYFPVMRPKGNQKNKNKKGEIYETQNFEKHICSYSRM